MLSACNFSPAYEVEFIFAERRLVERRGDAQRTQSIEDCAHHERRRRERRDANCRSPSLHAPSQPV